MVVDAQSTPVRNGGGGGSEQGVRNGSSWALGPARRPELAQLFAELLSRGRPVGADIITQVLDVTLDVELVLLEP